MRYRRPHSRKQPRESRTIRLRGSGEEDGLFYECWYCGFINKVGRNALGGRSGLNYSNPSAVSYGATGDGTLSYLALINDLEHYYVALELDSDGNPKPISHVYASDIDRGCSLCGTTNWRGDN